MNEYDLNDTVIETVARTL